MLMFAQIAQCEPNISIELPLKGESIASKQLQYDTLTSVLVASSQFNKRCKSYSIADTKLTKGMTDGKVKKGKYVEGYWEESWIVNRCSQQVEVPITFMLDGKGGAYYNVATSEAKRIK